LVPALENARPPLVIKAARCFRELTQSIINFQWLSDKTLGSSWRKMAPQISNLQPV